MREPLGVHAERIAEEAASAESAGKGWPIT